jgi:hypothetical protein
MEESRAYSVQVVLLQLENVVAQMFLCRVSNPTDLPAFRERSGAAPTIAVIMTLVDSEWRTPGLGCISRWWLNPV